MYLNLTSAYFLPLMSVVILEHIVYLNRFSSNLQDEKSSYTWTYSVFKSFEVYFFIFYFFVILEHIVYLNMGGGVFLVKDDKVILEHIVYLNLSSVVIV